MKTSLITKPILSPFVAFAFLVVSVTGVLLFFHIKNGALVTLHEWFGWGFLAVGCIHLTLNLRAFASYLKTRGGLLALALAVVLTVVIAALGSTRKGHGHPQAGEQRAMQLTD